MPNFDPSTITFTNGNDKVVEEFTASPPPGGNLSALRNTGTVVTLDGDDRLSGILNITNSPGHAGYRGFTLEAPVLTGVGNDTVEGHAQAAGGADLSTAGILYDGDQPLDTGRGKDVIIGTAGTESTGTGFAIGIGGERNLNNDSLQAVLVTGAGGDSITAVGVSHTSGIASAVGADAIAIDTDARGLNASTDTDRLVFQAIAGVTDGVQASSIGVFDSSISTGAASDSILSTGIATAQGTDVESSGFGIEKTEILTGAGRDLVLAAGAAGAANEGAGANTDLSAGSASVEASTQGGANGESTAYGISRSMVSTANGFDTLAFVAASAAGHSAKAVGIENSEIFTGDGNDTVYAAAAAAAGAFGANAGVEIDLATREIDVGASGDIAVTAIGIDRSTINTGNGSDIVKAAASGLGNDSVDINDSAINLGAGDDFLYCEFANGSKLDGGANNDTFTLHAGLDTIIDGGSGNDKLILTDDFEAFEFTQTGYGVHITDASAAGECDLRVSDVETFQFENGTYSYDQLFT